MSTLFGPPRVAWVTKKKKKKGGGERGRGRGKGEKEGRETGALDRGGAFVEALLASPSLLPLDMKHNAKSLTISFPHLAYESIPGQKKNQKKRRRCLECRGGGRKANFGNVHKVGALAVLQISGASSGAATDFVILAAKATYDIKSDKQEK